MATADDKVEVGPGVDAPSHPKALQESVAGNLSAVTGANVTPAEVIPTANQHPLDENLQNLTGEPQPQVDFDDVVAGERGLPRTDPAKNFLKVLWQRLKKKHPESAVKQEE